MNDIKLCYKSVYWWDGEYEGDCQLPENHLELYHFDGIHYYDDDNESRDEEQEKLEALIQEQVRLARIDELEIHQQDALQNPRHDWKYIENRIKELKNE